MTELIVPVPLNFVMAISAPPEVIFFALASFTVTVSTWVVVPSAVKFAVPGVRVDWAALLALVMVMLRR